MMKAELTVSLDKKLSLNYNSVGLSASIRIVKETADVETDLTALKLQLEQWLDQSILASMQALPRLTKKAKQLSDDIPY
jgi:hypothetical protein